MSENNAPENENTIISDEIQVDAAQQTQENEVKTPFQAQNRTLSANLSAIDRDEVNAKMKRLQELSGYTAATFKELFMISLDYALDRFTNKPAAEVQMVPMQLAENERIITLDQETKELIEFFTYQLGELETPTPTEIFKTALKVCCTEPEETEQEQKQPEPQKNIIQLNLTPQEESCLQMVFAYRAKQQLTADPEQVCKELIFNLDNLLNPKNNTGLKMKPQP